MSVQFKSAACPDLVVKTPSFYKSAMTRLNDQLGRAYRYAETHFGGPNLNLEAIERNIKFATEVARQRDLSLLRRSPPRIDEKSS